MKASWLAIVVKFDPPSSLLTRVSRSTARWARPPQKGSVSFTRLPNISCSFAPFDSSLWRKARFRFSGGSRKRTHAMYPAIRDRADS